MKKKYWIMGLIGWGMSLSSCSDFLDCDPQDFGDETSYFKTPEDLKMSVNTFYDILPKMKENNTGVYSEDNTSDNQIGTGLVICFIREIKERFSRKIRNGNLKICVA
ncbi:hypothetical protein NXY31_09845 [Bacteroides salyersiae]|nr:hypothetical protein [Bacteroides salyersiae]